MIRSMLTFALALTLALPFAEGCAKKNATKGSTAKGAAAKDAGQTTGSTATANQDKATSQGADYEGVTCDETLEGTAWCDSDEVAVFCVGGSWYSLDCSQVGGDVCAETTDAHVVDCDAAGDVD